MVREVRTCEPPTVHRLLHGYLESWQGREGETWTRDFLDEEKHGGDPRLGGGRIHVEAQKISQEVTPSLFIYYTHVS